MTDKTTRIRELNDAFRKRCSPIASEPSGPVSGAMLITRGVQGLPLEIRIAAFRAISAYDDFGPGNDPYGEHDFGSFEIAGHKLFWKIDYYRKGKQFRAGSETPEDVATTDRVLTIMLAEEY